MNNEDRRKDLELLKDIAHRAMIDRGLTPDFPADALAELEAITDSPAAASEGVSVDLRSLLWCSLDNDDSRDLDQLTAVENLSSGMVKVLIAIADVDSVVKKQSAIDRRARENTASVYTVPEVFPMLPERLSTDITSLNINCDRLAIVTEISIAIDGTILNSRIFRATVRNKAKLSYNGIAAWLGGNGHIPAGITEIPGMDENIRLQDSTAQKMRSLRHLNGALVLETTEARAIFSGDRLMNLVPDAPNRAKEIIEDFMIAANGVTAKFLSSKKYASIRRIVRTPKRWDRIVTIAAGHGTVLPAEPDPIALDNFLVWSQKADPQRFPDLSLAIIKLLGSGEYVVQKPGAMSEGHFGLAVKDYTHSTAPNRRYPDLVTQRLLKAALAESQSPYSVEELESLAVHCTKTEDAIKKVERLLVKSAAALLLESRIGDRFDALVTGASEKGTWVRITNPPLEGRLERGFEGLDVGQALRVELISTDVKRGFIDFMRVN